MRQLIIYISYLSLIGCNSGSPGTSPSSSSQCPADAPLFTSSIGLNLIKTWSNNVFYYSPNGAGGHTDTYVGAAYFTGALYNNNAVLLPTKSSITRDGPQAIYDYFTSFLSQSPQANYDPNLIDKSTLAGCGYGAISGYYNFSYSSGQPQVSARYTFQFQYSALPQTVSITVESGTQTGTLIKINQPAGWYIALQNSAQLPS